MPIAKKFKEYTSEKVRSEDDYYGVYELANSGNEVIYIGEGKIRTRLRAHFPDKRQEVPGAIKYRVEYTKSKRRCEQRERALQREFRNRNGQLPLHNHQLGDLPD